MKERHLRAFERVALCQERRCADVAGEHVRPSHRIDFAAERLGNRRFDHSLLQTDAQFAGKNLHDVARALRINFAQQFGQHVLFLDCALRCGDAFEEFAKL